MIDFHCHLDLYPDALKLLPEVARRNEFTLVVTTSPKAWQATSKVFSGYPNIKVGLGLHPEVAERKASELELLIELVSRAPYVGEIGLDASPRFRDTLELQQKIFRNVVAECQRIGGRIMSIHSRGAATRVLDVLEENPAAGTAVLHWFSGTRKELLRAIALGCWFSVGPAMLTGKKGLNLLAEMPADRILPETDGPFATRRGVPLMPWEAIEVESELAALWNKPVEAVRHDLLANLNRLQRRP